MLLRSITLLALAFSSTMSVGCSLRPDHPAQAAASATTFLQQIDLGTTPLDATERLRTHGHVEQHSVTTDIGGFTRTYAVVTLSGTGSRVEVTVPRPRDSQDLLLQIEEVHQRRPQAFGYTVAVNGTACYFRTYEELGAGPNQYFVRIPPAAIGTGTTLTITLTSAGAPPVSLRQIRVWGDFFTRVDRDEGIYRPMGLLGKHTTLRDGQPGFTSFGPLGDFTAINYAASPTPTSRKVLRDALTASATTGRPLQFLINGPTWAGGMKGPDGRGGYFDDLRYSLLSYDAANKSYAASFPNMWSSAFWSAFRDPWANAEMRRRLAACLDGSADTIDLLKAQGQIPSPSYLREMGPPMGEITAATVAAAARDGVVLDPTDGLSDTERAWLFRDGIRLWQEYAATNAELLARDSVIVDRGQITLPRDHLIMNQMSHTVFRSEGPMRDARWFGGQMGIVDGFWATGELFWDEARMYDYVKAHGKLVHGNLEGTILKGDASPLVKLYAAGFQYVNFFNEPKDVLDDVRKADGCDALPMPAPPHHEPTLLRAAYNSQASLGTPVSHDNVKIHSQPRENADSITASRLAVDDILRPGQITYRIAMNGEAFTTGLALHVDGRVSPGEQNCIVVLVGDSPASLQPVATLTAKELPCPDHWTPFMTSPARVDLGTSMVGRTEAFIRFELHAAGAPDAAFLLDASVASQWPSTTGPLAGNGLTMREHRTTQLWIQDQAVAERYLTHAATLGVDADILADARRLQEGGHYRQVCQRVAGAIAEVLPARYAVRGHGRLGRYPVDLRLADDQHTVVAVLHRIGPDHLELSLITDQPQQAVEVRMPAHGFASWRWTRVGPQRFRLAVGTDGTPATVHDGVVQVCLDTAPAPVSQRLLPRHAVVRLLGVDAKSLRVDAQDLDLLNHESSLTLPLAAGATVTRTGERLSDPTASTTVQSGDRLELSLDDHGRVTAVNATYGFDQGIIATVTPPNPMGPTFTNGSITLDNGHAYEFSYGTTLDTVAMHGRYADYETRHISEGLRPGQRVQVRYSPYTELGTSRRLLSVKQPWKIVLEENFTKVTDASWKSRAVAVEGLTVQPHKPEPNYLHHVIVPLLRPTTPAVPGSVVYRLSSEQPLGNTAVEFTARAFEDSSILTFAISRDQGATWVPCGRFDNTWQNSYPQAVSDFSRMPWQFIDLTTQVSGAREVLLKMTFAVNAADERACVGTFRVVTEPPVVHQ